MSTTDCGPELDLVNGAGVTQTRQATGLANLLMRTKSVWRVFRNRMAANCLHDLDERQLNDIGITRHDVVIALDRSGVLDDPTRLLAGAARERSRHRFARQVLR